LVAVHVWESRIKLPPQRESSTGFARHDIVAARRGDREAYARVYREFHPTVRAVVLGLAPMHEVEDVVQEVFLQAWKKLPSLRDPKAFPGWLLTIARNRCSDQWRRGSKAAPLLHEVGQEAPPTAEAREVLAAIRDLPDAYRETLLMRLVAGMSAKEIAARTGLTHASVRVNLHRGMKRLREALDGHPRATRGSAS
jgi:RNA polymerase sigma-70 factor (ECF subfamily)